MSASFGHQLPKEHIEEHPAAWRRSSVARSESLFKPVERQLQGEKAKNWRDAGKDSFRHEMP